VQEFCTGRWSSIRIHDLDRLTSVHQKLLLLLLHPFNGLGKPVAERQTILDFTGARDDGVAMASAGPCANHLHLAPDR